ncbi:MAG: hypothetical protein K5637_04290 [Lachnospiraceae bacterium]|nr:hypothetical protein [Lachnospiraceae bacterium]
MTQFEKVKLNSFITRLMFGTGIIAVAICFAVSIALEMFELYTVEEKYAYIVGLVICGILIVVGALMIRRAYHFEDTVVGRSAPGKEIIAEFAEEDVLASKRYLVTEKYIIFLTRRPFGRSLILKIDNLTACFEEPPFVPGEEKRKTEYSVRFYDSKCREHTLKCNAKEAEDLYKVYCRVTEKVPWIMTGRDDEERFEDRVTTSEGRRMLIAEVRRRREGLLDPPAL